MNVLSRLAAAVLFAATAAQAAPVTYNVDPTHTYPSFEADHMGISTWRGKFDRSSGAFKGTLEGFTEGAPTRAVGTLELHGRTNPATLDIRKFKCIQHPMYKREDCGADVYATIDREQFGMDAGKAYGFSMAVDLRIQVEAIATK